MSRLAPLIVLLVSAGPAAAQTPSLDRLRLDSLQQQNMRAQAQQNLLRRDRADARGGALAQHGRRPRPTCAARPRRRRRPRPSRR
jgi:hypothetical protein